MLRERIELRGRSVLMLCGFHEEKEIRRTHKRLHSYSEKKIRRYFLAATGASLDQEVFSSCYRR